MKIKISTISNLTIILYQIKLHTFIIVEHLLTRICFLKLPIKIKFKKQNNKIYFIAKKFSYHTFLNIKALSLRIADISASGRFTENMFKNKLKQPKWFFKKLFLQGLGFKVISFVKQSFVELKIGYSHIVKIPIPKRVILDLFIYKNIIVIAGVDKEKVGNFANLIKSFRIPDNYKGKGIWYKKEVKLLKKVKKS